jgi:hypothetical protein
MNKSCDINSDSEKSLKLQIEFEKLELDDG